MRRRAFLAAAERTAAVALAATITEPIEALRFVGAAHARRTTETPTPLSDRSSPAITRERNDGRYVLRYRWCGHDGSGWEFGFAVNASAYRAAVRRPLGYGTAFDAARRSPYARKLAARLDDASPTQTATEERSPDRERFDRALSFVRSLRYSTDYESWGLPDYHRAVEETLVDGCGDCKDLTYLLAGILSHPPFAYRTAMVFVPNHMLLGVAESDLPAVHAGAPTLPGTDYVAVESVTDEPVGTYDGGPVLAVYDDEFAYVDRAAIGETTVDFLRDPSGYQVVGGVDE